MQRNSTTIIVIRRPSPGLFRRHRKRDRDGDRCTSHRHWPRARSDHQSGHAIADPGEQKRCERRDPAHRHDEHIRQKAESGPRHRDEVKATPIAIAAIEPEQRRHIEPCSLQKQVVE